MRSPDSLPSWKREPPAVTLLRRPNSSSIQVAALVEVGCKRLGRHDDEERGDGRNTDQPHAIEPDDTLWVRSKTVEARVGTLA